MVDLHCHILPGVDDGAKDIEESLGMLRKAVAAGVDTVVATPHLIRGSYGVDFLERRQMTTELQDAADEREIGIQIKLGVECYLSPEILDDKSKLKELTINNNGKYILVELPMQNIPLYVYDVLFDLYLQGITPVLAHPERNMEICKNPNILFDFVEKGYIIQLNAGSLLGCFGRQIRKAARTLITHNLAHIIASDMHSGNSPTMDQTIPLVEELLSPENASDMFTRIPRIILAGESFDKKLPKRVESVRRGLRRILFRRKM